MSITELLTRSCTQTAVYWGNPVIDGFHNTTFDDPIEILCRWEDRVGTFETNKGEQIYSKATVYLLQNVDEDGYLYLGKLSDIDDSSDPKEVDNAFEIKRFDKSPGLGAITEFVRKAYL